MALFTGAFFVAQVSLIIVAKPFYAIFCTSCVPQRKSEDYRWQGRGELLRHFTGFYGVMKILWNKRIKREKWH